MNQKNFDAVYKQKLLDTFRFLIDFLNKNKMHWWAAYGTIIGAVRHHGLIPWDDDIDIWMPRSDYEKLLSMQKELLEDSLGHYGVEHVTISPNYGVRFAKVMDLTTTIQSKRFVPFISGVFVDVFPLDSSNDNTDVILAYKKRVNKAWNNYFDYVRHFYLVDITETGVSVSFLINAIKTNLKNNEKAKYKALKKALEYEGEFKTNIFEKCNHCFSVFGFYNERDIFQTQWFNRYEEKVFEDLIVRIPTGYHDLLTHIYGNYMTPPPIEKRTPRHKPYYINLKERLTIQDVAQRVKAGETIVF